MKVGPFFKWFGSKWSTVKHYPIPRHNLIIEPYAGSAGYALNYSDRDVVIFDLDNNLKKLWKWLINKATSQDILDIPVNLSIGRDIRWIDLSEGQRLLLKHWQRTNNVGDCWTISPWGNLPGQWTKNTRARLAEEIHAIKHWKFQNPFEYIDTPATWFLDPPYKYNYRYSVKLPKFKYKELVSLTETIHSESLIIVCEAKDKETGKIPNYLPFVESHLGITSRRKSNQSHHSRECIYIKEPYLR